MNLDTTPRLVSTPADSADSAFIPRPGNWVLLAPVMYSTVHLQQTDKSMRCCAWRMAVEMKIHHGMLLCQGEGHFWFLPPLVGESPCRENAEWTYCFRLKRRSHNIFLSLFGSMRWLISGESHPRAASLSCLETLRPDVSTIYAICWERMAFLSIDW